MKEYELTVLIHPDLEVDLAPALTKIKTLVEDNDGKVVHEENNGKKRLAYTIKGQDFAVYYEYGLKLPAAAPGRLSAVLNITDEVLRYLLVAKDERKAKYEARAKQRKSSEDETKEEETKE
jgi:small subunit ribosomal protein S6